MKQRGAESIRRPSARFQSPNWPLRRRFLHKNTSLESRVVLCVVAVCCNSPVKLRRLRHARFASAETPPTPPPPSIRLLETVNRVPLLFVFVLASFLFLSSHVCHFKHETKCLLPTSNAAPNKPWDTQPRALNLLSFISGSSTVKGLNLISLVVEHYAESGPAAVATFRSLRE